MTTPAQIVHRLPGRTRIRIQGRRRDAAFFERVSEAVREVEGIRRVRPNPATASLLVVHTLDDEQLDGHLREAGLKIVPLGRAGGGAPPLTRQVGRRIRAMDRAVREATDGSVDLGTSWFLFLAGAAALQAVRGRFLPATVSLLMYASRHLDWGEDEEGAGGPHAGAEPQPAAAGPAPRGPGPSDATSNEPA